MTEATITAKQVLQDIHDSLTQLIEDAENRRKAASAKNENYKIEYSQGEKHAYEGIAKSLKASIDKI
ncbi:MAG: hypothetical protein H8E32_04580 [Nitrospinae bacterium]|nr:hypothetical protein [Nitrospinota bacterium]